MAKATDISAPILTEKKSALSGIDPQSKAAFENALRESGDTAYVEQYVQEHPEQFLTPAQLYKLEQVDPESFWDSYNKKSQDAGAGSGDNSSFDQLIPKTNNGSPFVSKEYNADGWLIAHYADGSTKYILQDPSKRKDSSKNGGAYKASDGTPFTNYQDYLAYQQVLEGKYQARKSAYDDLYQQFAQFGLGSLVEPLKALVTDYTIDPSQYTFKLMYDPNYNKAYSERFSANADRIKKGLAALSPAAYIRLEDQYQNVMRNYGLPESYWKTGPMGVQEGFTKLIAGDVDPTELENRIINAQNRVINANPEVLQALKNFYPDIKNGDILAYVLDPQNALNNIKKQITASEIGGAAMAAGLQTSVGRAEQLGAAGVTGQAYQQASPFLTTAAQRGSQLADIYGQKPYGQTQAEQEAFNLGGATEAIAQRRKLKALEEASFAGSSGTSGGALSRDRAITPYMMGMPGAGAF